MIDYKTQEIIDELLTLLKDKELKPKDRIHAANLMAAIREVQLKYEATLKGLQNADEASSKVLEAAKELKRDDKKPWED